MYVCIYILDTGQYPQAMSLCPADPKPLRGTLTKTLKVTAYYYSRQYRGFGLQDSLGPTSESHGSALSCRTEQSCQMFRLGMLKSHVLKVSLNVTSFRQKVQ